MTSDELRAAAARLRANAYTDHKVVTMWRYSFDKQHDALALADAYLAEHPADDPEPVTAEWLHSHAVEDSGDGWVRLAADGRSLSVVFDAEGEMSIWMSDGDVSEYVPGGMKPHTRGEFRGMCEAFRIPLTESRP